MSGKIIERVRERNRAASLKRLEELELEIRNRIKEQENRLFISAFMAHRRAPWYTRLVMALKA